MFQNICQSKLCKVAVSIPELFYFQIFFRNNLFCNENESKYQSKHCNYNADVLLLHCCIFTSFFVKKNGDRGKLRANMIE